MIPRDESAPEFTKPAPILLVSDLDAEVKFYKKLGFRVIYQGEDFPGFVALGSGGVEFGLQRDRSFERSQIPRVLVWQFQARSLCPVVRLASRHGWKTEGPRQYWPEQDAWELTVYTPNGYGLVVEGPNPNSEAPAA